MRKLLISPIAQNGSPFEGEGLERCETGSQAGGPDEVLPSMQETWV